MNHPLTQVLHLRAHIRQLVCIALGAPVPTQKDAPASPKKDKGKGVDHGLGLPATIQQQKHSLLPSHDATEFARKLLVSFVLTNSALSLFRALPRYPLDSNSSDIGGRVDGEGLKHDGEDSFIAKVAQCVGAATNVWELIKPRFVQWESYTPTGASSKAKGTRQSARIKEEYPDNFLDGIEPAVVGDESWSVLNWLILIFDKDERHTAEDGERTFVSKALIALPNTCFFSLLLSTALINYPIHSEQGPPIGCTIAS
jgi:hypothetical protein